jgi:cell division protein FtsQ
LDETGVCIGRLDASSPLPVVTGAGIAPKPGGVLKTDGFNTAVSVLKSLDKNLMPQLAEVHVTPFKTVEAYTTEGIKIYLGRPEALTEKDRTLCGILKTLGDRKVVYIDLSAAGRPVVKFVGQGVKVDGAGNPSLNDAGSTLSGTYGGGPVPALPRD